MPRSFRDYGWSNPMLDWYMRYTDIIGYGAGSNWLYLAGLIVGLPLGIAGVIINVRFHFRFALRPLSSVESFKNKLDIALGRFTIVLMSFVLLLGSVTFSVIMLAFVWMILPILGVLLVPGLVAYMIWRSRRQPSAVESNAVSSV